MMKTKKGSSKEEKLSPTKRAAVFMIPTASLILEARKKRAKIANNPRRRKVMARPYHCWAVKLRAWAWSKML